MLKCYKVILKNMHFKRKMFPNVFTIMGRTLMVVQIWLTFYIASVYQQPLANYAFTFPRNNTRHFKTL